MSGPLPDWLNPSPWLPCLHEATGAQVESAISATGRYEERFATLIAPAADAHLELAATRARQLTQRHFGNTISLYAPLYISNHCPAGCTYCGFASDRPQERTRLDKTQVLNELSAMKRQGIDDVLMLTGDRTKEVGVNYIAEAVSLATRHMSAVSCEVFAMRTEEYARLADAGCVGLTLYHETYDPETYATVHPWGEKRKYSFRLEAPERAVAGGIRSVGIGVLLGLTDPYFDAIALFRHALHLRRHCWKAGIMISFPRICEQEGSFVPRHAVSDRMLARFIFAFRLCLPDVPLVLSTRERASFRDGMAGLGISRMSVASRTTVGGYEEGFDSGPKQFETSDRRETPEFCSALRARGLEPVFKNWDSSLSLPAQPAPQTTGVPP